MKSLLAASTFIGFILLTKATADAHTLQVVKDGKALLILDESPVAVGDLFQVTDIAGAEKAQIQIRQIKEKRAVAYVIKGELTEAPDSYQLKALPQSDSPTTASPHPNTPLSAAKAVIVPQAKGYYGGLSQNQMNISLTNSTTLSLSGLSFNFGAFYERAMTQRVQVLGRVGYEGLKATGSLNSNACGNSCDVDISYLSTDAIVKYSFYQDKKSWWLGGGLGFLLPVLKSSNVLDTGKLTISEKILLGAGLNWYRTPQSYIPVQLEYTLQPSNSIVNTSQIILRVGYGVVF